MKAVCLILTLSGHLTPVHKAFPHDDACNRFGLTLTDGQTVKNFACVPQAMVDGLPIYDCGKYIGDMILTAPPKY